jgi:hypothetical protein
MAVLNYKYEPSLVSNPVKELLDSLFTNADIRTAKQTWLECFTEDAKIWRNGKASNGSVGKTGLRIQVLLRCFADMESWMRRNQGDD